MGLENGARLGFWKIGVVAFTSNYSQSHPQPRHHVPDGDIVPKADGQCLIVAMDDGHLLYLSSRREPDKMVAVRESLEEFAIRLRNAIDLDAK
jgi:hypothetical protein